MLSKLLLSSSVSKKRWKLSLTAVPQSDCDELSSSKLEIMGLLLGELIEPLIPVHCDTESSAFLRGWACWGVFWVVKRGFLPPSTWEVWPPLALLDAGAELCNFFFVFIFLSALQTFLPTRTVCGLLRLAFFLLPFLWQLLTEPFSLCFDFLTAVVSARSGNLWKQLDKDEEEEGVWVGGWLKIFLLKYCCKRSQQFMKLAGTQEFSSSPYPFHLRRYSYSWCSSDWK